MICGTKYFITLEGSQKMNIHQGACFIIWLRGCSRVLQCPQCHRETATTTVRVVVEIFTKEAGRKDWEIAFPTTVKASPISFDDCHSCCRDFCRAV
jgi:hypothetical protein